MEEQKKKLHRSKIDHIVFGVCGGLGEYFDIDPLIVRIVFVLLAVIDGVGILLYIFLAIVMPKEPEEKTEINKERIQEFAQEIKDNTQSLASELKNKKFLEDKKSIFGAIIVIFGFIFLLERIFAISLIRANLFLPLIIIAIGLYIVLKKK